MRRFITLIILFFLSTLPALAETSQSIQQANYLVQLYMDTCTKFPGENVQVSSFAKENRYVRANEQFSKAALRNRDGEVWGVPNPIGQFLVVLTGDTHCSVWARTADAKTINDGFEKLVNGLPRPGLKVQPNVDKVFEGIGGQYRQLGYFIQREGAPHGWIMLSTTSESSAAEVQARLTISPSTP